MRLAKKSNGINFFSNSSLILANDMIIEQAFFFVEINVFQAKFPLQASTHREQPQIRCSFSAHVYQAVYLLTDHIVSECFNSPASPPEYGLSRPSICGPS